MKIIKMQAHNITYTLNTYKTNYNIMPEYISLLQA